MSDALRFGQLREQNTTRCARWHPPESTPWTLTDWTNAMGGECGEAQNIAKKLRRHETGAANHGDPPIGTLTAMLGDELADVVIYADLVAHYLGIDLGAAIKSKFNRTSRKFGFPERLGDTDE